MCELIKKPLVFLVKIYQVAISPLLCPSCRFYPTCSNYAQEALIKHGVITGGFLTLKRLLRCHPFGSSGIDFVPDKIKAD